MQAASTCILNDVLARAMEIVLSNDEINVARCIEWDTGTKHSNILSKNNTKTMTL
jgi:hypothetical protein